MKKLYILVFFFFSYFLLFYNVEATFTCDYECDDSNGCSRLDYFSLEIDPANEQIKVIDNVNNYVLNGHGNYWYFSIDNSLTEQWFESSNPNSCRNIYICSYTAAYIGAQGNSTYYNFYADDGSSINDKVNTGNYGFGTIAMNDRCYKAKYIGDSDSLVPEETDYKCSTFENKINKIRNLYQEIKNLGSGNAATKYKEVNAEIEMLNTYCKGVYSAFTYSSDCVKDCTHLESELGKIKDEFGIPDDEGKNAKCSLSSRLVKWILKLINWLRYIVPVLLIILSVLDFIKAIAADSEDEVKKVTSRFVKRLIVAVIIFILPLFLEFLLGIFGIDVNNFCL